MADDKKPAEEAALVFTLSAPIRAFGEDVTELRLRKPRAKDVFETGSMPVSINPLGATPGEQFVVDWRALPNMLSRLSGVPVKSLDDCDPSDLASLVLQMVNAGFFSAAVNDDIDAAIQLGLVFKTSPMPFFDLPSAQLRFLLERTLEVTKRANPDRGE